MLLQKDDTILFQGDSITDCGRNRETCEANNFGGFGRGYAMQTAARLLARYPELNLKIYNRGISGDRIVDLYARWKRDALNLKPTWISFLVGVNDTGHEIGGGNGVEVPRYDKFFRMILDWSKEVLPNVRFVFLEPFVLTCGHVNDAWLPEMKERSDVVKAIAKDYDAPFIPAQELFNAQLDKQPKEYWVGDGLHPTAAGHALLTDAWMKAIGAE